MSVEAGHEVGGPGGAGAGTAVAAAGGPGAELTAAHEAWLKDALASLPRAWQGEWSSSDNWDTVIDREKLFYYHSPLDGPPPGGRVMLWRFTSQPDSELIQVKAGTSLQTIVQVIGAHSGGNDKSNADVQTSSLCRNPGALLGTAASGGGDKKVLNIINRAPYLFGIDVTSLAGRGVSAHPALSRVISVIETEYVLMPTPGLAPLSISELATCRWLNPFKGRIPPDGKVSDTLTIPITDPQGAYKLLCAAAPQPAGPAATSGAMDPAVAEDLLKFAAAASAAASKMAPVIQMKEPAERVTLLKAAAQFASSLKARG